MSTNIETKRIKWSDVPEDFREKVGIVIHDIQTQLIKDLGVIGIHDELDDENDNGNYPDIDFEVHVAGDPDGSTRRLVVSDKEDFNIISSEYL